MKIEDEDRLQSILFELKSERLFDLAHELAITPFFMFKRVIRLKAEIKQVKSVISLIRGYL